MISRYSSMSKYEPRCNDTNDLVLLVVGFAVVIKLIYIYIFELRRSIYLRRMQS
uniref:Uncharacterized protein n=1 Tax=Picea sitchensis TaxID=3332 RepID=A0A6B9XUS5_PICSI|nr:hypothetical protein Q903MT_gene6699 [Picea sitchensis]